MPLNFFLQALNLLCMMRDLIFMVLLQGGQLFFGTSSEASFLFGLLSFSEGPTGVPDRAALDLTSSPCPEPKPRPCTAQSSRRPAGYVAAVAVSEAPLQGPEGQLLLRRSSAGAPVFIFNRKTKAQNLRDLPKGEKRA